MENEHIVLINFNDVNDGVAFMENINTPFSFIVNDMVYDYLGIQITTPSSYEVYNPNEIYLDIYKNPSPGVLYVDGGYLKYYKETGE